MWRHRSGNNAFLARELDLRVGLEASKELTAWGIPRDGGGFGFLARNRNGLA